MALDDDIRVLSDVRLFESFTREQLRLLAFGAETLSLSAGRKLYSEGAPADCAFVVSSGEVALFHQIGDRRELISLHGPGAILGELALIAEAERLTSAVAQTDVKVIRLSRSMFRRILEEFPDAAEALYRHIAADLQDMLARIAAVAAKLAK